MAQHFSQSKAYRDLTLWEIAKLTEDEARDLFIKSRWGDTTVMPCPYPDCGIVDKHYVRRTRNEWRCKHCANTFSATSGTPFADMKISFKMLLMIIYEFISAPQGCAANRLHSRLGISLRTAQIIESKLREVLWETRDLTPLSGLVHIDGGFFCGKPRRTNKRGKITSTIVNHKLRNRKAGIIPDTSVTHPDPRNIKKLRNRRVVLTLTELHMPPNSGMGAKRTIVVVVKDEHASSVIPVIRKYVQENSEIWTDSGNGYNGLSQYYDHKTVNHSKEYMTVDGVNNNQAESYISRLRRSEYGVYNGMREQYFEHYANEFAWRSDTRNMTLKMKFDDLLKKIFECGLSKTWRGYSSPHKKRNSHHEDMIGEN